MKQKYDNKQSRQTRERILKAVFVLMKTEPAGEIKVSEITSLAGISRNSFYTHYSSVENVIEDIIYMLINDFNSVFEKYDYYEFIEDPYPLLNELLVSCKNNKAFSEYVVFSKSGNGIVQGIIDGVTDKFYKIYMEKRGDKRPSIPYLINFLVSGVVEFVYKWFKDGKPVEFEEVIKKISLLVKNGVIMARQVKNEE